MGKNKIFSASLTWVLGFLLSQLFVSVFLVFANLILGRFGVTISTNNVWSYFVLALVMDVAIIAVALISGKSEKKEKASKISGIKIIIYILVGVLAYILLSPFINVVEFWFTKLNIPGQPIPYKMDGVGYAVSIFSLAILPAVCEEFLFRWAIFNKLKKYGKLFSIVVTSVFFSLTHMSINQLIYPFLMGLLLASIMYKENNIIYSIVVHFVCNFISITFSFLNFGVNFSVTYIVLAFVLLFAFIALLTWFMAKIKPKEKQKLSKIEIVYLTVAIALMLVIWVVVNLL